MFVNGYGGVSFIALEARSYNGGRAYAFCVGCDIDQADHAPDGGVAQEIFVKHHGKNQEEVEEELGEEVERQEEEDAQTTTCTCIDGMR